LFSNRKDSVLGKIDIDLYGEIAQEFGVSRDPASSFELPSLLLFKNGTEIRRLPELTLQDDKSNAALAKDTITRLGWSKRPVSLLGKRTRAFFFFGTDSLLCF
jgi:hypothetical protein